MTPAGFGFGAGVCPAYFPMGWDPSMLGSNLKLWLRPEELAVIGDTNNVSTWADQSGLGNDVTQGTADKQPVVAAGALDGWAGAVFDGIDDALTVPALGAASDWTIFYTFKINTVESYVYFMDSSAGRFIQGVPLALNWGWYDGGWAEYAGVDTDYTLLVYTLGASSTVHRDGALLTLAQGSADYTQKAIGGNVSIGSIGSQTSQFAHMTLVELGVCNSALSDADRIAWESYAAARYPTVFA